MSNHKFCCGVLLYMMSCKSKPGSASRSLMHLQAFITFHYLRDHLATSPPHFITQYLSYTARHIHTHTHTKQRQYSTHTDYSPTFTFAFVKENTFLFDFPFFQPWQNTEGNGDAHRRHTFPFQIQGDKEKLLYDLDSLQDQLEKAQVSPEWPDWIV